MKKQNAKSKRTKQIVRVSIVGILANLLLSTFKAIVGFMSGSIAIVVDAANNLSDAASSIITLIGAKFADKEPDHNHPFGHGRVEYLSAMAIGALVLYAGTASLVESIKKIISPITPDYSTAAIIVVSSAIIIKILLASYFLLKGKKLQSQSLKNSGKDAVLDVAIAATTLAAAIIFIMTGYSIEAYLATLISVVIIRSGIGMLREAASSVLGERPDPKLIRTVKHHIQAIGGVYGTHDLVLNNYGPDTHIGSVNIEVDDEMSADEIDALSRRISEEIYKKDRVALSSIGIYARNTKDAWVAAKYDELAACLKQMDNVLEIHGFYIRKEDKKVRFDVVVSFEEKDPSKLYAKVLKETARIFPGYEATVVLDSDYALA